MPPLHKGRYQWTHHRRTREQDHESAHRPNQSIEAANGVTFAYRRFGNADRATLPLVFFQHFRGNLDNWDPALVDAIAERREVILFDNAGGPGFSSRSSR